MRKILIVGSGGMLGHIVYLRLKEYGKFKIICSSNRIKFPAESVTQDVSDISVFEELVLINKPDFIINCIGVLIKGAKSDPANAIYINAFFPHMLAKLLDSYGGKLIHISTDCVFSGMQGRYCESSIKDAQDIYGLSKSLGEIDYGNHVTLRTSIIGPELKPNGEGLFNWFMNQDGAVSGFTKVFWGGVTTIVLADAIIYTIENEISGVCHVSKRYCNQQV
jgi:dTDP-4-dehydrorhamnose reductase